MSSFYIIQFLIPSLTHSLSISVIRHPSTHPRSPGRCPSISHPLPSVTHLSSVICRSPVCPLFSVYSSAPYDSQPWCDFSLVKPALTVHINVTELSHRIVSVTVFFLGVHPCCIAICSVFWASFVHPMVCWGRQCSACSGCQATSADLFGSLPELRAIAVHPGPPWHSLEPRGCARVPTLHPLDWAAVPLCPVLSPEASDDQRQGLAAGGTHSPTHPPKVLFCFLGDLSEMLLLIDLFC